MKRFTMTLAIVVTALLAAWVTWGGRRAPELSDLAGLYRYDSLPAGSEALPDGDHKQWVESIEEALENTQLELRRDGTYAWSTPEHDMEEGHWTVSKSQVTLTPLPSDGGTPTATVLLIRKGTLVVRAEEYVAGYVVDGAYWFMRLRKQ